MKKNVKCTIEDVINSVKEKYLKEGESSFYNNDWYIYVADEELLLTTLCCVTAPPDFDDETDEEIMPRFAVENGMDCSILPEIFQDVISNALEQKSDVTNKELINALNYYMDKDSFMVF